MKPSTLFHAYKTTGQILGAIPILRTWGQGGIAVSKDEVALRWQRRKRQKIKLEHRIFHVLWELEKQETLIRISQQVGTIEAGATNVGVPLKL